MIEDIQTKIKCTQAECEGLLKISPEEPESFDHPGEPSYYYCPECGVADHTAPPAMDMGLANNLVDLVQRWIGFSDVKNENDAHRFLRKQIFKNTTSGVVFEYDFYKNPTKVFIAPYTEGFDGEHTAFEFEFPITIEEFSNAVDEADRIGSETWECIHSHDEDCECYLYVS